MPDQSCIGSFAADTTNEAMQAELLVERSVDRLLLQTRTAHVYSIHTQSDLKHGNKVTSAKQHLLQRKTVHDSDAAIFTWRTYLCSSIITLHIISRAQLMSVCKECAADMTDSILCCCADSAAHPHTHRVCGLLAMFTWYCPATHVSRICAPAW